MKKIISLFLIFLFLFAAVPIAYAAETDPAESEEAHMYHLDIGSQHIWGTGATVDTAAWQNGYARGSTINVSTSLTFPQAVNIIAAYPYSEDIFKWGEEGYSYNKTPLLQNKDYFDEFYLPASSNSITNVKAISDGARVDISYSVKLEAKNRDSEIDLKEQLNNKNFYYLMNLLGGEAVVKANYPDVWQRLQEGAAGKKIGSTTYGYMYFAPVILEYEYANTCTACKECEIAKGSSVCSESSCPDWNTPDCGCYKKICTACGVCSLAGDGSVCSSSNCGNYNTPDCGCYNAITAGGCQKVITWNESETHKYGSSGHKASCPPGCTKSHRKTCTHVHTYQATLNSTGAITAAKPNGNGITFKSGYGFGVTMNNTITVKEISNSGKCGKSRSKTHSKTPTLPTSAEVRTNWTVKNNELRKTQPKIVSLESAGAGKFITAKNPISHYSNRYIYTDVALKGTARNPVNHTVTLYTHGGGVNGTPFCNSINLTFTINGNMYEDDWTVDGSL